MSLARLRDVPKPIRPDQAVIHTTSSDKAEKHTIPQTEKAPTFAAETFLSGDGGI